MPCVVLATKGLRSMTTWWFVWHPSGKQQNGLFQHSPGRVGQITNEPTGELPLSEFNGPQPCQKLHRGKEKGTERKRERDSDRGRVILVCGEKQVAAVMQGTHHYDAERETEEREKEEVSLIRIFSRINVSPKKHLHSQKVLIIYIFSGWLVDQWCTVI